jgi:hypothetical protein
MISMFPPMLGGYPKNLDIPTGYHSWYHFWNPLNIKNFDIWNDILIFGYQNNDIQSFNIQTIFFENMISTVDIKSTPRYGYERDLGVGCRLLGGSKQNSGCQCRPL